MIHGRLGMNPYRDRKMFWRKVLPGFAIRQSGSQESMLNIIAVRKRSGPGE